jgi:hypothetical protein
MRRQAPAAPLFAGPFGNVKADLHQNLHRLNFGFEASSLDPPFKTLRECIAQAKYDTDGTPAAVSRPGE